MTTDPGFEFLLATLSQRGLRVEVSPAGEPKLRGPAAEATPALKEMLAAWRGELVERFKPPDGGYPLDDDAIDAIAERAWIDPPDFGESSIVERESVILRLEGFPTIAISRQDADAMDSFLAAWRVKS